MTIEPKLLDQMGGIDALRPIINDFIDRVVNDVMIGFHFNGVDRDLLKQRELEFTARALGGDIPYTGRGMRQAHAAHPIMPGQFYRRLTILRETLLAHAVPQPVIDAILLHTERLRGQVLQSMDACATPRSLADRDSQ